MTDCNVVDLAMYTHKRIGDVQVHQVQCSTIDRITGRLTSYDNYTVQKSVDKPRRFHHKFSLQLYTAQELKEILNRNGFDIVAQYGMDGKEFINNQTLNMLTVAQKKYFIHP